MSTATAWRTRLAFRPLSVAGMATTWVLLWGEASPVTIIGGVLLGWMIGVVFPLPPIFWQGRFRLGAFLYLVLVELGDLWVSSLRMIQLVYRRKVELRSGIVRVNLRCDNDLYQVAVAILISLVPGTVVVEVVKHPRRLYLHVLDLVGDDAVNPISDLVSGIERRVLRAFATDSEIEAFERVCLSEVVEELPDEWEDAVE